MIYVEKITISPRTKELNVGDKYRGASAVVCPSNATCKSIRWYSADSSIATVTRTTGYIRAIAPGRVKIYAEATDGSGVSTYIGIVVKQPVIDISLDCSNATINIGETKKITATVSPSNASNKNISWTSCDESVATVTSNGVVTDRGIGSTTIMASACDGNGAVKECKISVISNGQNMIFLKNTLTDSPKSIHSSASINDLNVVGSLSGNDQVELLTKYFKNDGTYTWHKILYNGSEAYIAATAGLIEEQRWIPNFEIGTPIVDNRYLTQAEKETNAKIIYKYLYYKGWSRNAICGAIANMEAESTLSPGRIEISDSDNDGDFAYGLIQWDPPTKWTNYAAEHGYTQNDIYRQIDYLVYSMRYGGGEWIVRNVPAEYQLYAYEYIVSNKTPYELAVSFLLCYERPTDSGTNVRDYRGNLATQWLEFFDELGW